MLFNQIVFNGNAFDGGAALATVYSTDPVVFENFSLSDGTIMALANKVDSGATREIIGGNIPKADGMYVTASYFRERTITLTGFVIKDTKANLEAYLNTIRQNLSKLEGNLDIIEEDGTVKRYIATCTNYDRMFAGRQFYNLTICPFEIVFSCRTPFGKARTYTNEFDTLTSSPAVQTPFNTGTYAAQPVMILEFSSASGVSSVVAKNTITGEQISYSGSIAAGDILIFDSEQKTVTKNGTAVDFTGVFPTLAVGSNSMQYTINGTFTLDATLKFKPTYL